jgi:hypothetical protein
LWQRETNELDDDAQLTIRLNETQLMQTRMELRFQEKPRFRAILNIHGLTIGMPGVLVFEIKFHENIIAVWRVPVTGIAQVESAAVAG